MAWKRYEGRRMSALCIRDFVFGQWKMFPGFVL
jgi:hypothetical protein